MSLGELLRAMARRWYLTILVLLGTVGLCFVALESVPPTYETRAYVLLMPPDDPTVPENRLLSLGTLSQAKDVLIRQLDADETHASLESQGFGSKYTVTPDFTSAAPVVAIAASAETSGASRGLADELVTRAGAEFDALQDNLGIRSQDRITLVVLSRGVPDTVGKSRIRATVAAAGAGLACGALFIGFVDGLLLRRRRRGAAALATEPAAHDKPAPEPERPAAVAVVRPHAEPASRPTASPPSTPNVTPAPPRVDGKPRVAPPVQPRPGAVAARPIKRRSAARTPAPIKKGRRPEADVSPRKGALDAGERPSNVRSGT